MLVIRYHFNIFLPVAGHLADNKQNIFVKGYDYIFPEVTLGSNFINYSISLPSLPMYFRHTRRGDFHDVDGMQWRTIIKSHFDTTCFPTTENYFPISATINCILYVIFQQGSMAGFIVIVIEAETESEVPCSILT